MNASHNTVYVSDGSLTAQFIRLDRLRCICPRLTKASRIRTRTTVRVLMASLWGWGTHINVVVAGQAMFG